MKLIRDGYINIIPKEELDLEPKSYDTKLNLILDKIREEIVEFLESKCRDPKELGDIMETVVGLGEMHGFDFGIINQQRKDKLKKFGGFRNFVVLKNAEPKLDYSLSSDSEEHF
jgi:predicted house-cleaning noncanonical NTP pyrophosphatase (MazG superfamily)